MRSMNRITVISVYVLTMTFAFGQAKKEYINPFEVKPTGYTHVVVTSPGKTIYISGQVATNAAGEIVGKGDLKAQTIQVFENLKTALTAAGASFKDVVKMSTFVVNYNADDRIIIREVRSSYLPKENPPASTLVGVQALYHPDVLIEIEAIAVIQ